MRLLTGVNRREFCRGLTASSLAGGYTWGWPEPISDAYRIAAKIDKKRILKAASEFLPLPPATITSFPSDRSPGGPHDFFSQADYFWPDPKNPQGPYVNRDGQSNPANFSEHRAAMIALSIRMPALTAAWMLTGEKRYGQRACEHLRAWFISPDTRMNPNLEFAQGVHGVSTGRSYGIIDTLHLVEVARAASLVSRRMMSAAENDALRDWFRSYLLWMKSSDKGRTEGAAFNNHATCWALQATEYARLIGDSDARRDIRQQYIEVLLPGQLAEDGSFPKELTRTKPYSYSIFNFDVMTMLCVSLRGTGDDLILYRLPDGRGIRKAAEFLYPYLKEKDRWPYRKDVEHFDSLPVRSPGLLFAGLACGKHEYVDLWMTMNPDPQDPEIVRNYPIRQPLLWCD